MSRWLDLFRQTAVPIDSPVQIGQKGAVRSENKLSAPNRPICTSICVENEGGGSTPTWDAATAAAIRWFLASEPPAEPFVLVQSEFYAQPGDGGGIRQMDWPAAMDKRASHVVFNGKAFQYKEHPLQVELNDRVRLFVVSAGPSFRSDFHVVGTVFDRVYPDGNPDNVLESVQTWTVPAGGGAVFETTFQEGFNGVGLYPFVTHAFADAEKGAVGLIQVREPMISEDGSD